MWLVAGLGNPGSKYQGTRHNIGFEVEDRLRRRWHAGPSRAKYGADLCEAEVDGERVILLRPQEYMNLSGQAVGKASKFWKVPPANVIVVHDELDLPFARLRVAPGGGPGGHNGIKSIIEHLGDREFPRVRVGIGRPVDGRDAADYVLGRFSSDEQSGLPLLIDRAADAVAAILAGGTTAAMNTFNVAPPRDPA